MEINYQDKVGKIGANQSCICTSHPNKIAIALATIIKPPNFFKIAVFERKPNKY
jgi:hypothetical protein